MSVIALLTDFGLKDHYVGAMKGVILQVNPKAAVVDITHEIGPQDLYHAAFVLRQAFPYFPPETIFTCVIDPTVGTSRRILAVRYNNRTVLAPDNGLITLLHRDAELQAIRVVENQQLFNIRLSSTFHGRDIFAPIAAHLSRGVSLDQIGPTTDHIELLDLHRPRFNGDGTIDGEIFVIDHFGNLISNISTMDINNHGGKHRALHVSIGPHEIGPVRNTYAEVPVGHALALIGSSQMLEIAVNGGNAAKALQIRRGTPIKLH